MPNQQYLLLTTSFNISNAPKARVNATRKSSGLDKILVVMKLPRIPMMVMVAVLVVMQ